MLSRLVSTRSFFCCQQIAKLSGLSSLGNGRMALTNGSLVRSLATVVPTAAPSEVILPKVDKMPASYAKMFAIERYWIAGMLPLFPAALFIHHPVMDFLLATFITLHTHWGLEIVITDYARPFVVGSAFSKLAHYAVYVVSIAMFAALLHFNYNDVGITKAFEMIWSL